MRRAAPALVVAALAAAGCGDDEPAPPPKAAVALTIDAPGDLELVRAESVEIRGRVTPASSTVLVRGEKIRVSGGAFATSVGLDAGTNVIDVLASAPDTRPAMTALRVRKQVIVRVPDLVGSRPDDAAERLAGLGLESEEREGGGVFDSLLPGPPRVCDTDPAAGDQVDVGATVQLVTAREC